MQFSRQVQMMCSCDRVTDSKHRKSHNAQTSLVLDYDALLDVAKKWYPAAWIISAGYMQVGVAKEEIGLETSGALATGT
jgi:hypothetical protein